MAFEALIDVEVKARMLELGAKELRRSLDDHPDHVSLDYAPPATSLDDAGTVASIKTRRDLAPAQLRQVWKAADVWHNRASRLRDAIDNATLLVDLAACELDSRSVPPLQRTAIAIRRALHKLRWSVPHPEVARWTDGARPETMRTIEVECDAIEVWVEELRLLVQPPHSLAPPGAVEAASSPDRSPPPILRVGGLRALFEGPSSDHTRTPKEKTHTLMRPDAGLAVQARKILRYLRDRDATDWDHRVLGKTIARDAFDARPDRIRGTLAKLVQRKFLDSQEGPHGGYWITQAGFAALIAAGDRPPPAKTT